MSQPLEARVLNLETTVAAQAAMIAALMQKQGSASPGVAAPAAKSAEILEDAQLDKDWAQAKVVRKDPSLWVRDGKPSFEGVRYAECPPEFLESLASAFDYKAKKGREENPPRLNSKGKPWYESDEFEAKLCRGFAARIRAKGPAKQAQAAAPIDDEDIPF